MRLLIMGAPGAGKGTQASRIADRLGIPTISTGDIFRRHIKDETSLGLEVKAILEAGDYVPDEVTEAIVTDRLAQDDAAKGWLLDGFPRTPHQVGALDDHLVETGTRLDAVISLVVDPDLLVERLLARAADQGRADDNETTIRNRMDIYTSETEPLLAAYRSRGLLVEVDGVGSVDEVTDRIAASLQSATSSAGDDAVNADHD